MKRLDEIAFDYARCREEVEDLRTWLATKDELSERGDILTYFRTRPQMAVLFMMFNQRIRLANRIAWEFDLFGDFACDLVVGEWEKGEYCLVEFEDARKDSIFRQQGKKATREWGPRFEHGYSQVVDWAHKLDCVSPSADLLPRFGQYEINYEAVLVIGRDGHLDAGERQRWAWRNEKLLLNSKKVICMTFDELLSQFTARLSIFAAVEAAAVAGAGPSAPLPAPPGPDDPQAAPPPES